MDFTYVTPYWRDSQTLYGEGISAYTGTYFFILNANSERANVQIFFYDLEGNEYTDMQVEMILPEYHVLDFRIIDIIAFRDVNYRNSSNLRTGWLKIICDFPLNISGKIVSGNVNSIGVRIEDSWSIPFEQLTTTSLNPGAPQPFPPMPSKDFQNYLEERKRNK